MVQVPARRPEPRSMLRYDLLAHTPKWRLVQDEADRPQGVARRGLIRYGASIRTENVGAGKRARPPGTDGLALRRVNRRHETREMTGDAVTDTHHLAGNSPGDGVTRNVYVYVLKRTQTSRVGVQIRCWSSVLKP